MSKKKNKGAAPAPDSKAPESGSDAPAAPEGTPDASPAPDATAGADTPAQDAKQDEPKPQPSKPKEYVVSKGCAVGTRLGQIGEGKPISAGMLDGGDQTMAVLMGKGAITEVVEPEPEPEPEGDDK